MLQLLVAAGRIDSRSTLRHIQDRGCLFPSDAVIFGTQTFHTQFTLHQSAGSHSRKKFLLFQKNGCQIKKDYVSDTRGRRQKVRFVNQSNLKWLHNGMKEEGHGHNSLQFYHVSNKWQHVWERPVRSSHYYYQMNSKPIRHCWKRMHTLDRLSCFSVQEKENWPNFCTAATSELLLMADMWNAFAFSFHTTLFLNFT